MHRMQACADTVAPSRFENLGNSSRAEPASSDTRNFSGLGQSDPRPSRGNSSRNPGPTGTSPDGYRRRVGSGGAGGTPGKGGNTNSPFGSNNSRRGSGAGYERQSASQQGWSRPLGATSHPPSSGGGGRVTTRISPALPPVKSPPLPPSGVASEAWAGDGRGAPIQHRPWKLTEAESAAVAPPTAVRSAHVAAAAAPNTAASGNATSMHRLKAMRESQLAKTGRSDQREAPKRQSTGSHTGNHASTRSPVLAAVTGIVARPEDIRQRDAGTGRRAPPGTLYNPSTGTFEEAAASTSKPVKGGGGMTTIRPRKYDFKAEQAAREALEAHKARRSAAERAQAEQEQRKAAAATAGAPKPAWGGASANRAAAPKAALGERPKKAPVPAEQRVASLEAARAANLGSQRQQPHQHQQQQQPQAQAQEPQSQSPVWAAASPAYGIAASPVAHTSKAAQTAARAAARQARALARLLRRPRTAGLRYVQVLRQGKLQFMDYDEWYNTDSTGWPKEAAAAKERARAQVEAEEAAAALPPSPAHRPGNVGEHASPAAGGGDDEVLALGGSVQLAPRTHSSGWDLDEPANAHSGSAQGGAHLTPDAGSHGLGAPVQSGDVMHLASLSAVADAAAASAQPSHASSQGMPGVTNSSAAAAPAGVATLGSLGAVTSVSLPAGDVGRTVALSNGQVVQARQVTTQDGQVAVLMLPVPAGSAAAMAPTMTAPAMYTPASSQGLLGGAPPVHPTAPHSAPMYAAHMSAGMGQDMFNGAGYGATMGSMNPSGALWGGGAGAMPGMDMWGGMGGGMPAQWGGMPGWGMNPAMYGAMGMMGAYMPPQGLGMMQPGGALGMGVGGGQPVSSTPHAQSPRMTGMPPPKAYGSEGLLPPPAGSGAPASGSKQPFGHQGRFQ